MNFAHQPVLLTEVIAALAIKPNGVYVDATFGRGGHSQAILDRLGKNGRLIAIDKDRAAIAFAQEHFKQEKRLLIYHGSFDRLHEIATQENVVNKIDGVLLDLGVSSPQLDDAQRGFSFLQDGPLDMRMDTTRGKTAAEWLKYAKEKEIADVLWQYGEEKFSRRMARAIVAERILAPIETTARLADIVRKANPRWEKTKHPATRAFQAIRIFINQELTDLSNVLEQAIAVLAVGGRLAVISFHSLEDRIVKRFIRKETLLKKIGKFIKANEGELAVNPRSRSAILRVAEKTS
jgi:16S rRNA (cytosine1402-N4)-methyltransferase